MGPHVWLDTGWLGEYRGLSVDEAIALAHRQGRTFQVLGQTASGPPTTTSTG